MLLISGYRVAEFVKKCWTFSFKKKNLFTGIIYSMQLKHVYERIEDLKDDYKHGKNSRWKIIDGHWSIINFIFSSTNSLFISFNFSERRLFYRFLEDSTTQRRCVCVHWMVSRPYREPHTPHWIKAESSVVFLFFFHMVQS